MKEPGDVLEETTTVVARDFRHLKEHVDKAESVAKLCNGVGIRAGVRKFVLARKISRAISTVRRDVRDFSTAHNLALTRDLHVSVQAVYNNNNASLSKLAGVSAVNGCF